MTSSPTSVSDSTSPSSSFARLHPRMQRWVHDQGWTSLHDAQERAIEPILRADSDVIIAAATAAGKTEAAFLPILSRLASDARTGERPDPWTAHDPWTEPAPTASTGVQVLYLSPLKALINDQYDRLEQMCEHAEIPVHRWHGDVGEHAKRKVRDDPSGVLLITPESLEATFVNRGTSVPAMFAGLRFVVIDEMHSFMSTPRGAQLQSLMNRVEYAIRRRAPRIGLSATLGDMTRACEFLRPAAPGGVTVIASAADTRALQLQVRGYVKTDPAMTNSEAGAVEVQGGEVSIEDVTSGDRLAIAEHLFRNLRGRDNLVFANARRHVELFANLLSRRSEADRVPNEFWPHHGSLSKEMRESVEAQLKDRTRPATAICTSTLEMGIDIGSVSSVAQIGPPPTVAAMRQRLGRSGRRDEPSVLRAYVSEPDLESDSHPVDQLRCDIVQTIAMVELMLERWVETPDDPGFNYSTLIQQVLSTIAQHGGARAADLHRVLCGPGPFALVDQTRFARLLRAMATNDLISQASDGLLLPGATGERRINHYSFYTAFQTEQEWRLVVNGRTLGSMPISQPLYDGVLLIFAGQRWKVTRIDTASRVVELERSSGGNPPAFGGTGSVVSDEVRARMVAVYRSDTTPAWLDRTATELLQQGRAAYRRYDLDHTSVFTNGKGGLIFGWTGDRALFTTALAFQARGIEADVEGPTVQLAGVTANDIARLLTDMCAAGQPDPLRLAAEVQNRDIDKWDWVLDDELAHESNAARLLDVDGAWRLFDRTRQSLTSTRTPSVTVARATTTHLPPPIPVLDFNLRQADLLTQEFCVIDVETTGFSPRLGDRILEVAAVRMRGDGTILSEWSTLVNPERDVGATRIHGITAGDVLDAPRFADIAGDLLRHTVGAVLVAHNYRFDRDFIAAEYQRAGTTLPPLPAVCTLSLGALVHSGGVSRRLSDCCAQLGIELTDFHDALGDARAAAAVLTRYIRMAIERGNRTLADIGCVPLDWPASLPALPESNRQHRRGGAYQRVAAQADYLAALVARVDTSNPADPDTAAYLEILDRALEDRRLSETEAHALAATAAEWGLQAAEVAEAHKNYFSSLLATATADGVITDLEHRDLVLVGSLLQLRHNDVECQINDAQLAEPTGRPTATNTLAGMSVCFTGALNGRIAGEPITRDYAHELAESAGLVAKSNVSRGLDLLVIADPDSLSGKARKARDLGTRVIAEQVFWNAIGVVTD